MGKYGAMDKNEKIGRISALLNMNQPVDASDLAERWKTSPKTIQRAIKEMKRRGYPIQWKPREGTYVFTDVAYHFPPTVFCGRDEVISVLLAVSMMENFRFAQLAKAMGRLKAFFLSDAKEGPKPHQKWSEKFSYMPAPPAVIKREIWESVVTALIQDHKLEILHEKANGVEPVERVVYPLHLRGFLSGWYLVAHCALRNEQRTFNLHRILKARDLGEQFVRDNYPFDPDQYFQRRTQVFRAESLTPVRLRFSKEVAKRGLEVEWFDKQKVTRRSDGSLDVTFEVAQLDGVADFILRWRGSVEVVEPKALKDLVKTAVRRLNAVYR